MHSILNGVVSFAPIVLAGGAIGMVVAQLIDHSKLGIFFEKDKNLVTRTLILFVVGAVAALLVWALYCLLYSLLKSKMHKKRHSHNHHRMQHEMHHEPSMDELENHCNQQHPDVDLEDCVYSHRNMYAY